MMNVKMAAPPQLKNPEISRYASTTNKLRSVGAKMIGVPKSEKLTAKMTKAVESMPGITKGNVIVINVSQPFALIFVEASVRETSLTLKAATFGQSGWGKKKNIWTIAIPVIEYGSMSSPSPPSA